MILRVAARLSVLAVAVLSGCGGGSGGGSVWPAVLPIDGTVSVVTNEATTEQGLVRGVDQNGSGVKYLGIPYATPPVGKLRWREPMPAPSHEAPLQADKFGSMCTQPGSGATGGVGNEDCLYLNVFAPPSVASNRDAKLPVIFEIHGGGNTIGSGGDQMNMALTQNAVVVTLNYRLGVAGYFAHPALTSENSGHSGNYGLLDQQLALRWVQTNIAAFGGDPHNVTITGDSAGGSNVYFHLASPLSNGLFHKAFAMSGGYHQAQVSLHKQELTGMTSASAWGCEGVDGQSVLDCLRSVPAGKLATSIPASPGGAPNVVYAPIVDNKVLTEGYISAFSAGRFNRVPLISGFARDEGTLWITLLDLAGKAPPAEGYVEFLGSYFGLDGSLIAAQYPLADYETPSHSSAAAWTDWHMSCGAFSNADSIGKYVSNNYAYIFSDRQAPKSSSSYPLNDPILPNGAYHGSDTQYWWSRLKSAFTPAKSEQLDLAKTMQAYLGNFVKSGNPNGPGLPLWGTYQPSARQMITLQPSIKTDENGYATHKCDFWNTQVPSGTQQ